MELLAFGSGYAGAHGSGAVRALQRRLAGLGYAPGPIDGRYGPLTDQAVRRFQATHGLLADGIDGPVTRTALASAKLILRPGDGYRPGGSGPVRTLQRHLADAGFSPGLLDGRYGPVTERAVLRFQATRHLKVDGVAGPHTLDQLGRALRPQIQPRTSPRSSAHRRPAPPRTRPLRTSAPRTLPKKTRPGTRHRGGTSLTPWLIVLACLMLAALAWRIWHGRRQRDRRTGATPAGDDADPGPGSVPATKRAPVPSQPDLPDDPAAGAGVFRLAQALMQAGRRAPAVDALCRAHRLGHPDAAFELGVLLLRGGDVAGAEDAFRRADERGHPGAACNLGVLLEQRGDFAGGRAAYERADACGEAVGAYNLGLLLEQERDLERAKAAFTRAVERGEPAAELGLGRVLEQQGNRDGARHAFERALQLGPPDVVEVAHAALRELHIDPRESKR
ncbi:MAG TPA: peptidoglycan-binding protein [Solirubrobacteraceae bacterium]|nr:peptidoglycan-binding protein [Solirubrobacteraceae bacterium]